MTNCIGPFCAGSFIYKKKYNESLLRPFLLHSTLPHLPPFAAPCVYVCLLCPFANWVCIIRPQAQPQLQLPFCLFSISISSTYFFFDNPLPHSPALPLSTRCSWTHYFAICIRIGRGNSLGIQNVHSLFEPRFVSFWARFLFSCCCSSLSLSPSLSGALMFSRCFPFPCFSFFSFFILGLIYNQGCFGCRNSITSCPWRARIPCIRSPLGPVCKSNSTSFSDSI